MSRRGQDIAPNQQGCTYPYQSKGYNGANMYRIEQGLEVLLVTSEHKHIIH